MDPKILTESGLKSLLSKHKIKDNGLQKALAAYDKLDDDAHDDCLETIAQIGKLAATLKKVKDVAANKAVADYLDDLVDAADKEEKDVAKAKAESKKTDAADQKKKEKEDKEKGKNEEEDEEEEEEELEGEYGDRLLTAFKKLKTMNGTPMKFVVCDARPFVGLAIGKRVGTKQKEELSKMTGGSKRFLKPALCFWDGDQYVFEPEQMVPGLAKKLVKSVKNFTGKKFRIVVGDESAGGDDDKDEEEDGEEESEEKQTKHKPDKPTPSGASSPDEPGEEPPLTGIDPDLPRPGTPTPGEAPAGNATGPFSITGSVGRGGQNKAPDVQAVQAALNSKAGAGLTVDGKCGPKTIAAITAFQKKLGQAGDGRVDVGRGTARALAGLAKQEAPPAPPKPVAPPTFGKPSLEKAPDVWHNVRGIIETNIGALKKAVQAHYAQEHPDLITEIEQNLKKLNVIAENIDHRLGDALKKAHAAADDAARKTELKNAKGIMVEYIKYVKSEPLIAHVDDNPWVKIDLKKTITDTLTHMAQSIGV